MSFDKTARPHDRGGLPLQVCPSPRSSASTVGRLRPPSFLELRPQAVLLFLSSCRTADGDPVYAPCGRACLAGQSDVASRGFWTLFACLRRLYMVRPRVRGGIMREQLVWSARPQQGHTCSLAGDW
ncbi:hypothetical protein IF1G_02544 [Cordyceps javanica]|uniref:Uncharacterized protein n=1 Tax=Cordyceps javanica TaxID=43265 RepID=A0A545V9R3_9HYPO|nr:hypothetical protein IF1G_02544 [Cordyceps javanica]